MVKAIVESHGGRVSAHTKSFGDRGDHGLIMMIALPQPSAERATADLPITVVKEGMPELGRVIQVLQNADVVPHIAETAAGVDPKAAPVLVGDGAGRRKWPTRIEAGKVRLVALDEDVPVVSVRGAEPRLFAEDYVLRELLALQTEG